MSQPKRAYDNPEPSTSRQSDTPRRRIAHTTSSILELPESILITLLCYICRKYLSISPVMVKDGQYICGNCFTDMPNKKGYRRCSMYENLAKGITFPCRNQTNGCTDKFLFNTNRSEHCRRQKYSCYNLSRKPCSANLSLNEIKPHFEQKHKMLFSINPAKFTMYIVGARNMIIEAFNNIFICHVRNGTTNTILHGVQSLDVNVFEGFQYSIKLFLRNCVIENVANAVRPYQGGTWVSSDMMQLYRNLKSIKQNEFVRIEIEITYKPKKCRYLNCEYTSSILNLKKHEKYFCNYATTCFACSKTVVNILLHLNEDHKDCLNSTRTVPRLLICDKNWWTMAGLYYCRIVEQRGSMILQITSSQTKSALQPKTVHLSCANQYVHLCSRVNKTPDFDWEWNLSVAHIKSGDIVKLLLGKD